MNNLDFWAKHGDKFSFILDWCVSSILAVASYNIISEQFGMEWAISFLIVLFGVSIAYMGKMKSDTRLLYDFVDQVSQYEENVDIFLNEDDDNDQ